MVFSSPIFLFAFLPIALLAYYISPKATMNYVLLACSLFFYAWGEVLYIAIMVASIISNYAIGRLLEKNKTRPQREKLYITIGIVINIGLLISFKYSNFLTDNINSILSRINFSTIDLNPVHLPLGISFFTFQSISYIVDVYKREVPAQNNIFDLALYISLFPQLIAGPIVRYHDISSQIENRSHSPDNFARGVQRFIYGLAKKILIANSVGEVANSVFANSHSDLTMPLAWIGAIAYSLQIFFDFSGYSDMAIGLGRMFGFQFQENFNYPYVSRSLQEFWRRWHISLSTWFRDYVYIPLGGNRGSTVRTYVNLLIVFVLTGLWHGASWQFLAWGLFHGVFLASEHAGLSKPLKRLWKPIQHIYVLTIVIVGWVLFRADNLSQAIRYLRTMIDISNYQTTSLQFAQVLSHESVYVFLIGFFLTMPIYPHLKRFLEKKSRGCMIKVAILIDAPRLLLLSLLLFLSIMKISSSTYNPFIYFRF